MSFLFMPIQGIAVNRSHPESGQILILTALTMIVLLGIAALSLDASFMYDKRNRLHAAADAAAKSAAIEVKRNPSVSQASLEAFADQQVAAHGFTPTRLGGTTTVTVYHPPISEPYEGNMYYVETVVSETTSTFFANALGMASMTPGATAIAGAGNPSYCLIINNNLTIGNTEITMNGCGVGVGGNLAGTNPNAEINGTPTPPVGVTGTCSGTCTGMGALSTGAPLPTDPLAGLAVPPQTGVNCPGGAAGTASTLDPGCYTTIRETVRALNPGVYYVTGKVEINSLRGTNAMIYLAPGGYLEACCPGNNKELHITAPTSGTYQGVAIFQDPSNTSNFTTGQNFTLDVTGAIYMPGADVNIQNSLLITNTTCTLFIAKSLSIGNGNGTFSNTGCSGLFGGAAFLSVSIAK